MSCSGKKTRHALQTAVFRHWSLPLKIQSSSKGACSYGSRNATICHGRFKLQEAVSKGIIVFSQPTQKTLYGLLTTILLIAAVGAVIISITSPHDRDARSALALKLPGLTLWLRVSSCVLREIFFKKRKKERQTVCHFHFSFRDHIMNFTGVNQRNKNATNYKQVWEVNWQTFICY